MLCGTVMAVTDLSRVSASDNIAADENGHVAGLF